MTYLNSKMALNELIKLACPLLTVTAGFAYHSDVVFYSSRADFSDEKLQNISL